MICYKETKEMEQDQFLETYFKDKPEFILLDPVYDHETGEFIVQQAGDDFTNVDVFEENNCYYCKISSNELGHNLLANFVLPESYEKFKTLLNIFLNTDQSTLI